MTSGRAVPVLSLLTVLPLPEGSSKELSLLHLTPSTQHGRSPLGSVKQLWDDGGGKKCSLTVLVCLCICNKSLSSENRKEQVH